MPTVIEQCASACRRVAIAAVLVLPWSLTGATIDATVECSPESSRDQSSGYAACSATTVGGWTSGPNAKLDPNPTLRYTASATAQATWGQVTVDTTRNPPPQASPRNWFESAVGGTASFNDALTVWGFSGPLFVQADIIGSHGWDGGTASWSLGDASGTFDAFGFPESGSSDPSLQLTRGLAIPFSAYASASMNCSRFAMSFCETPEGSGNAQNANVLMSLSIGTMEQGIFTPVMSGFRFRTESGELYGLPESAWSTQDPTEVPEPSTFIVLAGLTILALAARVRPNARQAGAQRG